MEKGTLFRIQSLPMCITLKNFFTPNHVIKVLIYDFPSVGGT